ncbi:MAG: glycosyltransferase [Pseudomonadota bacterium]
MSESQLRFRFRFSVVIPTKERYELTRDALIGLAAQSLPISDFEVVVVDNGSTDDSADRLRELDWPFRCRIVDNPSPGHGPAPARNYGVSVAEGELIAFLDSDCRPDPNWLKVADEAFLVDPEMGFVTGVIDFKPEQREEMGFFSRKTVIALTEHPSFPTANSIYRKSVFEEFGGFDADLSYPNFMGQTIEAADTDLAWRVIEAGKSKRFLEQAVVYHEVQTLPPGEWLMEPYRLYLLPALVKAHPGLRDALLYRGLLFYRNSAIYYLAAIIGILGLILFPAATVLSGFSAVTLLVLLKSEKWTIDGLYAGLYELIMNTIRNYVMCAALVAGSIHYRTLVL